MTEDFIQENEERELFRLIKQGSEEAFRVVYGKYHRILYAVALKMLKDRSAAENAGQQAVHSETLEPAPVQALAHGA